MKTVALITEYNPFHNGHQYHIEKAKEITGADHVIVVMSGNYVQRGEPAIMPKELRTKAALLNGASLVLELPLRYATGSAEQFAYGAVSILNQLGCVDFLCFGSECGDIDILLEIAHILVEEPEEYRFQLQANLRTGMSFPVARVHALEVLYPQKRYGSILNHPNNILGVEYLKSLIRLNSSILPYTILRVSNSYHDESLTATISSATAIRKALADTDIDVFIKHLPTNTSDIILDAYQRRFPIHSNDFSLLLKYRLMQETKTSLASYEDVSEDLAGRIWNHRNQFISYDQFCELLKTKEMTYSRISRALLHILLGVKKEQCTELSAVRILGFQTKHVNLLSEIKKQGTIRLLAKASECNADSEDIRSANLYETVITDKFQTPFINEYEHPMIRI